MEELTNNRRIRCNFSNEDMKFFSPSNPRTRTIARTRTKEKVSSKHEIRSEESKTVNRKKEKKTYTLSLGFIATLLAFATILSGIVGIWVGIRIEKEQSSEINHMKESLIRSDAIADYKAMLAEQEAEEAAIRMQGLKDEAARRQEIVLYFAKLFEGVRDWGFDTRDLVTYAVCVYNRVNSPLFANTVDEVIHQENQWINYSDNNDVVVDYKKLAEKVVDLLYNSDTQLVSSKYCWIEIQDGRLYLKDSYTPYTGMILWRYSEDI